MNIFVFHLFRDRANLPFALRLGGLNLILGYAYNSAFARLLTARRCA